MNTAVDAVLVENGKPDAVIRATGATPFRSDAEISDATHAVEAWQILRGAANPGSSAVVAGWRCDWIGMGLAEKLAQEGCHVRLAVDGAHAGQNLQIHLRDHWAGKRHRLGVEVMPYARLFGADGDTAWFYHMASGDPIACDGMDTLVLSQGHQPVTSREDSLRALDLEMHLVGDCLSPRSAEEAIDEGLMVARAV